MSARLWRDACLVVAGVGLVLLAFVVWLGVSEKNWLSLAFGADYTLYMETARGWLANGSYFHARQLGGPHDLIGNDVLYPPVALYLFVPFSFLPPVLWWAVPLAISGAALWRLRPAFWAWCLMPILLVSPRAVTEVLSGNPFIWTVAALFAAVAWDLPGSLALFKPSLFPFALYGIWTRQWWLGAGLLALLSLPFLDLTLTWVNVVLDTRGAGLLYSIAEWPYALIPWIAWAGSARVAPARRAAGAWLGGLWRARGVPAGVTDPRL